MWPEDEAPLLADLRRIGIDIDSVWYLDRKRNISPEAIALLLEHLGRPYHPGTREGIARALGTRAARPLWGELARLYIDETDPRVKDGLADAVAQTVTNATLHELLALLGDPRHGTSRVLLLTAKFPASALSALERLAGDPDLRLEVPRVLQRLRRSRRAGVGGPPTPLDTALDEASSGLDRATVPAFLARLVRLGIGFRGADARAVQRMVDDLADDEERELRFDLAAGGGSGALVVRAFQDDPEAVDLHLYGAPGVVALIRNEIVRLADEAGR